MDYRPGPVAAKFPAVLATRSVPTLVLRLCGDVGLTSSGGAPVEPPLGAKTLALLAYLALEPGAHRREQLTALLWGEFPEDKAKASLRQALTHLRNALGDLLRVDRTAVQVAEHLECDVNTFSRLASQDPPAALAIDIPQFLASLTARNCREFEEWADSRRTRLLQHYSTLLRDSAREALARRAWHEARQLAERWGRLDPLADGPIALLMEAHFLAGDRDAALAVHARYVGRLEKEEARAPRRSLVELAARIADAEVSEPKTPRATESWYEQAPSFAGSLVGRAPEWETLRRAWSGVVDGASRIVLLEGEPGVGKSRLATDFLRWVTSQGGVVLRGRGYDARAGAPFGAVIEALRSALDAPGLAGADPEWLAEASRVLPELRRRFPGLTEITVAGVTAEGWRLFESIAQMLLAIAEEAPVAVMIDDLHWCDADSCALLHFLVRRLAGARVLWCVAFTVGEIERDAPAARFSRALRADHSASHLTLAPLAEEEVWQLIRELGHVDAPTSGRRLAARIHEATAGNPFYVIELLKTLFAQQLLSVDPATGAWIVPPSALSGTVIPELAPTVHDAIAERIECLPDGLHSVLITIASAVRGCRTDVLSHLHGISRLRAAMLADALVERHLATEDEGVYRCAHPTIAHVVRSRLTTSRRREVHRALALGMEQLLPTHVHDDVEVGEIASHAEQADDHPMACRYALLASEAASRRCAYEEALSWLDLAGSVADTPEESDAVIRTTTSLLQQAGWREAPAVRAPESLTMRRVEHDDLDLPMRM